jgi:phosphoribosylglycinamide formyltransferase 1
MIKHRLNTALLISGGGSTATAIMKASRAGRLDIRPVIVIANHPKAGGLKKAKQLGVETKVINPQGQGFGHRLLQTFEEYQVGLVSQNGWLPLTPAKVVEKYPERIINQHPGPLDPGRPDFGGKGMYGARVACARLAYLSLLAGKNELTKKDYWTEATTHFVTPEYDKGQIIKTIKLNLANEFPFEKLSDLITNERLLINATQKVQSVLIGLEHQLVIDTLQYLSAEKRISDIQKKPLIPKQNVSILNQAKQLAIKLFPKG